MDGGSEGSPIAVLPFTAEMRNLITTEKLLLRLVPEL